MATRPLRIIFAGTPEFAATSLEALIQSEHQVVAVYTQPDRPAGRGRKLTPSAVKTVALKANIPVLQPLSLKEAAEQQQLAAFDADLMVVAAYGLLLPAAVLTAPKYGCINVHASLLPRWRGAAPIHRALMAGDQETGITIMQMDEGLDTGNMLLKLVCPITLEDTSGSLHDKLADLGAEALLVSLQQLLAGELQSVPQNDELACYAAKLTKAEGMIDWSQKASVLDLKVRGLNPWPVAYTELQGERLRIWHAQALDEDTDQAPGTVIAADKTGLKVATGCGVLEITQAQLPGGKQLPFPALLNARQDLFRPGNRFETGSQQ